MSLYCLIQPIFICLLLCAALAASCGREKKVTEKLADAFEKTFNCHIIITLPDSNLASQDNERFILRWVPMDGYHSPWLHRIQESMALILQRLVEALCRDHTQ